MVGDRRDHVAHVVGGRVAGRHDVAQLVCDPVRRVVGLDERSRLVGVLGQIPQDVGDCVERLFGLERAQPTRARVDPDATELAEAHPDTGELCDHRRAGHQRHRVGVHDHRVAQAQHERGSREHGSRDRSQDRDDSRAAGNGGGGRAPPVEGIDALRDVGPARGELHHEGGPLAERESSRRRQALPVLPADGPPTAVRRRPGQDDRPAPEIGHRDVDGPIDPGAQIDGRRAHAGTVPRPDRYVMGRPTIPATASSGRRTIRGFRDPPR